MSANKDDIYNLIKKYLDNTKNTASNSESVKSLNLHPLTQKTYNHDEIIAMVDVLLDDRLTMGNKVKNFEEEFAKYLGVKYAVMVNSGSSANLLAFSALSNFKLEHRFKKGDKIIIPAICWSTSVWPIIQMGLEPVFIDIDINTLNIDIEKVEKAILNDSQIKGVLAVHIIGNSTNMEKLLELKVKHNLILIEDTCESLGSKYNNKFLGTYGECGTYSFYFSHHITTVEGGMIVTDNEEIYELLKCQRAHGWTRNQKDYIDNPENRFTFINLGYNLRPMEIQGAMGLVQLSKLEQQNMNRKINYKTFVKIFNIKNNGKYTLVKEQDLCDCCWFVITLILDSKYDKSTVMKELESKNIETRAVVTGNFLRQPVFENLDITVDINHFTGANKIHDYGFFIGLPAYVMSNDQIEWLVDTILE